MSEKQAIEAGHSLPPPIGAPVVFDDEVVIDEMHFSRQRGIELRATHPRVYMLIEALVEWFKQSGAVNFCETTMHHEELGTFDIIMQRHEGKTPATLVVELKAEIERLKANNKETGNS